MKKHNPQEILNEILLRMNYDSKKTLSENSFEVKEQNMNESPGLGEKIQMVGKDAVKSWDIETFFMDTPFGKLKVPVGTKPHYVKPSNFTALYFRNCDEYDSSFPPDEGRFGYYTFDNKKYKRFCPTDKFLQTWLQNNNNFYAFITPDNLFWVLTLTKQKGLSYDEFTKISSAPELLPKNSPYVESRGWEIEGFYNCYGTDEYYKCVPYDSDIMTPKSFTEKYLPVLLNIASVIISIIPGVGWIGIAIAISLDLAAAGIQYYYGDSVGAAISVLLSLVPFIGMFKGVAKYPDSVYKSLAQKFSKAETEDDVIRIFSLLDNPVEKKAMADLLTNPGITQQANWQYKLAQEINSTAQNQVLKFLKNKDKADKIIKMTKELSKEGKIVKDKIPFWATTGMSSAAKEIGVSAPLIYAEIARQPDKIDVEKSSAEYAIHKLESGVSDEINKSENKEELITSVPKADRDKKITQLDSVYDVRKKEYTTKIVNLDSIEKENSQLISDL